MSETQKFVRDEENQPWSAIWLVEARWAHPAWAHYLMAATDLTTDIGEPPLTYKEGVTHEFLVYAINPDKELPKNAEAFETWVKDGTGWSSVLTPANHAYQFTAESNEAAHARIAEYIDMVERAALSPDTDYARAWDHLFEDGVSLRQ